MTTSPTSPALPTPDQTVQALTIILDAIHQIRNLSGNFEVKAALLRLSRGSLNIEIRAAEEEAELDARKAALTALSTEVTE